MSIALRSLLFTLLVPGGGVVELAGMARRRVGSALNYADAFATLVPHER